MSRSSRSSLMALVGTLLCASPALATVSTIGSNFNGTAIPAGRTIWFNAVFNASGIGAAPVTLLVRNARVTFASGGTTYVVPVPDSIITLSTATTMATAEHKKSTWVIQANPGSSGSEFLAAVAFTSPGLPGGINPVSWTADFSVTSPGVSLSWKWAAAVYTTFSGDLDSVRVKAIDANSGSIFNNSHHAGTPEDYTSFIVGGARGGGGSNYTGSYSGTASVTPQVVPPVGACCAGSTCSTASPGDCVGENTAFQGPGTVCTFCCPTDFNHDNATSIDDFLLFLQAYEDGSILADFDGDGGLSIKDLLEYIISFKAGDC